ncbi:unnamed protein product [Medioppia subpectinata]|uniref:Uncharacterized protein n=1 Tax=Medioppia subpectinata TaxID=1979941 RepID=A0A7R9LS33_9ACAR|nr:unnamed protein product [Medioppia subpectinata]CAG2121151.1 unnamed protein product [Medioppia subpectinata]
MKQTDGKDDNRVTVDDHVNEADDPLAEEFDTTDLPTSLIITNIDSRCFAATSDIRDYFEDTFKTFDPSATFQYFKSFRRVRVNYGDGMSAAQARIRCHQMRVGDEIINCYFAGVSLFHQH